MKLKLLTFEVRKSSTQEVFFIFFLKRGLRGARKGTKKSAKREVRKGITKSVSGKSHKEESEKRISKPSESVPGKGRRI